ncbi:ferrochelatase [Neisseria dumasiana]|uniref:Ferrochelatase n=1 Tax=Neisseria dumasiana TaxID=1931275 RepID=A0ABX3WQA5_9NEIS|nr:ferrochelatase [Neisseria dumasiana]OSI36447.1 ferrochelatase [Neisseria dumasiana]UOO83985.1 ferrochelatase [Neisseria dumasiana]
MPRFLPEPPTPHHLQEKTAVLLLNLGTPEAPTAAAVRPYLRDFLSDQRVVELPKLLWQPILRGLVLTLRPKKSAHAYEKVWLPEGSPLAVYTEKQAELVAKQIPNITVRHAMTYGSPNAASVLAELKAQGITRVLAIPLYPQYAASSTGAALDKIFETLLKQRNQISIRTVSRFYSDSGYIDAMKQQIEAFWTHHGRGEKLMLSFHGIPQKNSDEGDPYAYECQKTAELLADALSLEKDDYIVSFQSQFGKAKWIGPSTQDLFDELPKQGITKLDVFCPGFVSDCLETMEEIAIAGREQFHEAGGKQYQYIPCLNTHPAWIYALSNIVKQNIQGWD